ncbi:MAG: Gfo/Idh/MocA family oxidoreductase [Lentisphaeria bacterium]|nr:Gfo/Idh/MocA family oxidoreductase [Lentisphaeria bacterium]
MSPRSGASRQRQPPPAEGHVPVSAVKEIRIGLIMNGVTGRMGTNQHLLRSIVAIRADGGVPVGVDTVILPDPILVGRNAAKLEALSRQTGIAAWSTDLDNALGDQRYSLYFDAQTTQRRPADVLKAIAAGKDVYCEKPTALTTAEAHALAVAAEKAGVRNGVVQDKLWLPGFQKYRTVCQSGLLGRLLSVRGEFGYWVFEGHAVPPQRPSWNYRAEDGGGIIGDMFCHWRYVLDHVFGKVTEVFCEAATMIPERVDEEGKPYACTAEDAAYSLFRLEGGVIAQFYSSWAVRVRRDDLLSIQADGTSGSAVVTLRDCYVQPRAAAPRAVWNPDVEDPNDYRQGWTRVPTYTPPVNAFRAQWELFLRHLAVNDPFPWTLMEGAKGVQLAELGLRSAREHAWVQVPDLGA